MDSSSTTSWTGRPRMPPALLVRSTHHSVPRRPAWPTGAAMPARIARMPILTGSDGTPGRAWARTTAGKPIAPAAAAPPATFRNCRLVVAISFPLVVESDGLRQPASRRRASATPAVSRLSFSKATQRGTGKKPQSGTRESRSAGMCCRQRATRSATSSGVSM